LPDKPTRWGRPPPWRRPTMPLKMIDALSESVGLRYSYGR
jgi:hypothetical protein